MRVFLTGASGFIGQATVRAMRGRGWDVVALVRDSDDASARWLAANGVALVRGDVTVAAGLTEAMAGADAVVHGAGVYELGADRALQARMQRVNVDGTDNVLGAALAAGIARTVYVSTVWALGPSGYVPEPAHAQDETHADDGLYLSPYARSKAEAHRTALAHRRRGLPLVIAMPNGVCGPNDHSSIGYYLRAYLCGVMTPVAFGRDAVYAFVDVDALAEGLCLAVERAPLGEDYVFCGEPLCVGDLLAQFYRFPGGMITRWWLPRPVMRPLMAALEPLLRAAGLPAFLSRDTVDVSYAHLNYSSEKARRDLGWTHPGIEAMWTRIITRERELMSKRHGLRDRLRHTPVLAD